MLSTAVPAVAGTLPLTSQRDQYRVLMQQGMSNAEACRVVGVNRKTGHPLAVRPRRHHAHGRDQGTCAPISGPPVLVSSRYLSERPSARPGTGRRRRSPGPPPG